MRRHIPRYVRTGREERSCSPPPSPSARPAAVAAVAAAPPTGSSTTPAGSSSSSASAATVSTSSAAPSPGSRRPAPRSRSAPSPPTSRAPRSPTSRTWPRPTSTASTPTAASTATRSSSTSRPSRPTRPRSRPTPSSWCRPTRWSASSATPPSSSARWTAATGRSSASTSSTPGSRPSATRPRTAPRSTWARGTARTGRCQYALAQHVSKIVFDQSNVPGTGYIAAGPAALAKAANTPIVQLTENVPITDANSVAIKEVNDAGPNGAVVLNFTPPQALVILQAAQKLGLENRVKLWGCSTPCNTDFLAQSLGSEVERQAVRQRRADPARRHEHHRDEPVQGDPQAVRLVGPGRHRQLQPDGLHRGRDRGARAAVDHRRPTRCRASTPRSRRSRTSTPACCASCGPTATTRCTSRTTPTTPSRPNNGKMTTAQGCTPISAADPQIAQYRSVAGTAANAP